MHDKSPQRGLFLYCADKIPPMSVPAENLFDSAYCCLLITDPLAKASAAADLYKRWMQTGLSLDSSSMPVRTDQPGRPDRPELVHPRKVPKRSFNSPQGRVRFAHAVAHIEFNAINLALDAVYRFRNMPDDYYTDWLRVASEESSHFLMLNSYLEENGSYYGEFSAHNGLWEMALKTDTDVLVRMALVPRVLEARGLDVTPGMIVKLKAVAANELAAILEVIHQEEIGHVLIGTRWFNYCCEQRGLPPRQTFMELLKKHMKGSVHGPFDELSRTRAGFTREEMLDLANLSNNRNILDNNENTIA